LLTALLRDSLRGISLTERSRRQTAQLFTIYAPRKPASGLLDERRLPGYPEYVYVIALRAMSSHARRRVFA